MTQNNTPYKIAAAAVLLLLIVSIFAVAPASAYTVQENLDYLNGLISSTGKTFEYIDYSYPYYYSVSFGAPWGQDLPSSFEDVKRILGNNSITYDVTYSGNQQLHVHGATIKVTQSGIYRPPKATLSVSPSSIEPGQSVTVTYTYADFDEGIAKFFSNGVAVYTAFGNSGSDSFTFTPSGTAGTYDVEVYNGVNPPSVATASYTITTPTTPTTTPTPTPTPTPTTTPTTTPTPTPTATPSSTSATAIISVSPSPVEAGGTVTVSYSYIGFDEGIAKFFSNGVAVYTAFGNSGSGTFTFAAPSSTGNYDVRVYNGVNPPIIFTASYTVVTPTAPTASLFITPTSVEAGSSVVVNYSYSGFDEGMAKFFSNGVAVYTAFGSSGSGIFTFTAPSSTGRYDVRVNNGVNSSSVASASYTVTASSTPTSTSSQVAILSVLPSPVEAGSPVTVNYSYSGFDEGMAKFFSNGNVIYTAFGNSGSGSFLFTAPNSTGNFDVQVYNGVNPPAVSSSSYVVIPSTSKSTDGTVTIDEYLAYVGSTLSVHYNGHSDDGEIGLYVKKPSSESYELLVGLGMDLATFIAVLFDKPVTLNGSVDYTFNEVGTYTFAMYKGLANEVSPSNLLGYDTVLIMEIPPPEAVSDDFWGLGSYDGTYDINTYLNAVNWISRLSVPTSLVSHFNAMSPAQYRSLYDVPSNSVAWFDDSIGAIITGFYNIISVITFPVQYLFKVTGGVIFTFQSVFGWATSQLSIPMMIICLTIDLIPDEIMNVALLLFGFDLIFLALKVVAPGLISVTSGLGSIAKHIERRDARDMSAESTHISNDDFGSGFFDDWQSGGKK